MLFAGLESGRMVKNCDRGLENAALVPYGQTLSRQIAFLFFLAVNWLYGLQMNLFTQPCH